MYSHSHFNHLANMKRQLPTASTSPGYPAMPTEPIAPIFHVPTTTQVTPSYPTPTLPATVTPAPAPTEVVVPAAPPVLTNIGYLQTYLKTLIGKNVRIDFLIGTNTLIDRDGVIEDVGISYVVLREPETKDRVVCDLYAIKFVTVFE